jgi:diguanylate cyclase (GGDEF)-like protein
MSAGSHHRMARLAALTHALARPLDPARVVELAAEGLLEVLEAASASLSRVEPGTGLVHAVVNVGDLADIETRWPEDETYQVTDFTYLRSDSRRRSWSTTLHDQAAHPAEHQLLVALGKGCSAGATVLVDDQVWGEVYVTRHLGRPTFDSEDHAYLETVAAITGAAISTAVRATTLERLAYLDPLTGLANRRALDEKAGTAFTVQPGQERVVSAVCVDINGLKTVNDHQGHVAGDHLIKSVARALVVEFARLPGALVARVGGDEFVVLVAGHSAEAVLESADSLCGRSRRLPHGAGVSAGACSLVVTSACRLRPAELLEAADRAQYDAKRRGVPRTVVGTVADPGRLRPV